MKQNDKSSEDVSVVLLIKTLEGVYGVNAFCNEVNYSYEREVDILTRAWQLQLETRLAHELIKLKGNNYWYLMHGVSISGGVRAQTVCEDAVRRQPTITQEESPQKGLNMSTY